MMNTWVIYYETSDGRGNVTIYGTIWMAQLIWDSLNKFVKLTSTRP